MKCLFDHISPHKTTFHAVPQTAFTENGGGVPVVLGVQIGPDALGRDDRWFIFREVVVHKARGADVVLSIDINGHMHTAMIS